MAVSSRRERGMQYLLGKLPEQEAVAFEEQCFLDDDLFEEMAALENDLVDSFVRGELSEAERQQFEKGYAISPARRANLRFSKALTGHLATLQPASAVTKRESALAFMSFQGWLGRPAWAGMALVAIAALALALALSRMTVVNRRLRHEIDSVRAQQTQFQRHEQELLQQIATLDAQLHGIGAGADQQAIATPPILSLVLTPGLSRSSAASQKLVIAPAAPLVKLTLYLEHDDYPGYRASVNDAEGRRVWEKKGLTSHPREPGGRAVTVQLSSSILKSGEYLVSLAGLAPNGAFEEVEDYRFQVVRR